jgi:hypothetical protein
MCAGGFFLVEEVTKMRDGGRSVAPGTLGALGIVMILVSMVLISR